MDEEDDGIITFLRQLPDPRSGKNIRHELIDIIVITICAIISGCDSWDEIEIYGKQKKEWLKKYLKLKNGIPSHDTLRRVFINLKAEELQKAFTAWVDLLRKAGAGENIAIDGKTIRRTFDEAIKQHPLHMVSAWANENKLILGQTKTSDHSNEIVAIPQLLKLLDVKGTTVTIDAIGCQKEIAKEIKKQKADYVLAVKGNQPTLHEDISLFFTDPKLISQDCVQKNKAVNKEHGRIETREYFMTTEVGWLKKSHPDWAGLESIGMVRTHRIVKDKESTAIRYYISSLKGEISPFADAIRSHWGIENSLHWVLDMTFREDESRIRKGESPENVAIIRRIALNLARRDKSSKYSIKTRRKMAGWDDGYLEKLLFAPDDAFPPRQVSKG
jgi:predicted transposase YbfD/YdcC